MDKKCNRPILGICAGMQIIGVNFNSSLKKVSRNRYERDRNNKRIHYFLQNLWQTFKKLRDNSKIKKCIQRIKHKEKEIMVYYPTPKLEIRKY